MPRFYYGSTIRRLVSS